MVNSRCEQPGTKELAPNQNKVDNAVKDLEQGASHKPTEQPSKSFTLGSTCNIVYS